jgi:hypothetical protein
MGAFTLSRAGDTNRSAEAEVASVGKLGGKQSRSESLLRSAGVPESCGDSTDAAPHPNCSSPIQAFLLAIPGRVAEEGPPGTVKTDFVSANAASRWDVYVDDQVVCTTPCSRWVNPAHPVALRTREDGLFGSERIHLPNLGDPGTSLQLQAHATARGELVSGITFTTFGGMGVISGIALAGVGCGSSDHDGMCSGGLITLAVGALVTAGAIWLITDSLPHAELLPGVRAGLTPAGIAGTF